MMKREIDEAMLFHLFLVQYTIYIRTICHILSNQRKLWQNICIIS